MLAGGSQLTRDRLADDPAHVTTPVAEPTPLAVWHTALRSMKAVDCEYTPATVAHTAVAISQAIQQPMTR